MFHRFISAMILPIYVLIVVYNIMYVLLDSFIRAQGSCKQDFFVENCPLHTMIKGQIYAGVKCLQNIINNIFAMKTIIRI